MPEQSLPSEETGTPSRSCWDRNFLNEIRSAWAANPIVFQEVLKRMTGTTKFWLNWAFEDHLSFRPRRMLSIGCGDGAHELLIARNKYVDALDAFDASPVGIEKASRQARSESLNVNFYVETFENFAAAAAEKTYDLVMFAGSLHHVRDIEHMLDKVRRVLLPQGVIIFNEYIGPCYNIYGKDQVTLINRMLSAIAPEFKTAPNVSWVNPTIEMVFASDPTESVRSALIPMMLDIYFEVTWRRYFGGALLHPIFDHLNGKRLGDRSSESDTIVRLLIETENMLTEVGALSNDFCFGFARHRS